jgi:hypothetical protein
MTRPKKTAIPASRRGGAKSAKELAKVGPSRPAGPGRDIRTAEGRSGSKASDARQTARPTKAGLGTAGSEPGTEKKKRPARSAEATRGGAAKPTGPWRGPRTGKPAGASGPRTGTRTGSPRGAAVGVDLGAPDPETAYRDRDGETHRFAESPLKRVAAQILRERSKPWRYRPFPFPLFTDKGAEQTFYFDFYVYDNMDMILKLVLVVPRESAEVWDKIGRFKKQFPMYSYELWTPEKLSKLKNPRTELGF